MAGPAVRAAGRRPERHFTVIARRASQAPAGRPFRSTRGSPAASAKADASPRACPVVCPRSGSGSPSSDAVRDRHGPHRHAPAQQGRGVAAERRPGHSGTRCRGRSRAAAGRPLHQHVQPPAEQAAVVGARPARAPARSRRSRRSATTGGRHRRRASRPPAVPSRRAVGEDVDAREADLAHHAAGRLEVGVGLAGEADDDVGGEGRPVERRADAAAAFEEAGAAVAPLHARPGCGRSRSASTGAGAGRCAAARPGRAPGRRAPRPPPGCSGGCGSRPAARPSRSSRCHSRHHSAFGRPRLRSMP